MSLPSFEPLKIGSAESVSPLEARVVPQFRYRILVVDDEPAIRETMQSLLENQGYDVLTAADGLDGILALSKSLPDVIISDLYMPRMSGFEFLTIVRQRFPHIAIVAMSGEYVLGQHVAVIKADAFWQKGQPTKKLLQEITKVVAASPARPESAKAEAASLLLTQRQRRIFDHQVSEVPAPKQNRSDQLERRGPRNGLLVMSHSCEV